MAFRWMGAVGQTITASLIGFSISSGLFWLTYLRKSELFLWPQFAGFFLCWITRGIHNASVADYWAITMPANAILYTLVILFAGNLVRRARSK
jgi:hypothetical protein